MTTEAENRQIEDEFDEADDGEYRPITCMGRNLGMSTAGT